MASPAFLIAEAELCAAVSTRKLCVETAKFNVITAHSVAEAIEFLQRAPDLYSAAIISSDLAGANRLLKSMKQRKPELITISVSPNRATSVKGADHHVPSHEPDTLVDLCRKLFGDPRTSDNK